MHTMCGIIGYSGAADAAERLLEGLSALEYRGYDSAGVSLFTEDGRLLTLKAQGRLANVTKKVRERPDARGSHCGIGHTRWATHGAPSDRNSHPHGTALLQLVHNGIIENYAELRAELEKLGYVSASRSRKQIKQLPPSVPMKFTSPAGRVILVGKNNLQNDKLTFTAEPGETWLHAKDMPGSHVIIPGDAPDDETLLFAARVAAKYSKGGTGSHVPVDYTLRKYVKKPSGAKPGFVIYTHQRTLYVDPITEV